MNRALAILAVLLTTAAIATPQEAARAARDRADSAALLAMAATAQQRAAQHPSAAAYVAVAHLDAWAFEAAMDRNHGASANQAVEAGVGAAQRAIALDAKSADAHAYLGALLGDRIALHPTFGGMRYGASSAQQLELALQLDPANVGALIAHGIAKLNTPSMFGGSPAQAVADLQHAAAIARHDDTPHLWLAQAWMKQKQWDQARQEIAIALKLDGGRAFTRYVAQEIAKHGQPASGSKPQ